MSIGVKEIRLSSTCCRCLLWKKKKTHGDKLQKLFREMERINETTAGFMATNVLKKERILHQEPSKCQD